MIKLIETKKQGANVEQDNKNNKRNMFSSNNCIKMDKILEPARIINSLFLLITHRMLDSKNSRLRKFI